MGENSNGLQGQSSAQWLTGRRRYARADPQVQLGADTARPELDRWPQSLRTAVSLCLASNFPINALAYTKLNRDLLRWVAVTRSAVTHSRAMPERQRREAGPSLERSVKRSGFRKSCQVGDFPDRKRSVPDAALSGFPANSVEEDLIRETCGR